MRLAGLAFCCLAVAALSALVVAPAPAYDPWSWLLWGRELAHGTLSTAEGPAFKPLPVAITTPLSVLGDGAPVAWVIFARAASVAAIGCAFVLARDVVGGRRGIAAGALAAIGVAFCGAFPKYALSGDVTGLLLAFALGGVLAWRAERPGLAFALAVGCGLLRVEAWPFVLVLGVVLWRRGLVRPVVVAGAAAAVLVAWFVPEWLGSGDLLRSGERARVPNPGQPALADVPGLASLEDALGLALLPLLLAAVLLGVRRAPLLVAAGAAWIALVALMAQVGGFSGEARYAVPGAALLAVAGAVGLARLPKAAVIAAALLVVVAAVPRIADLDDLRADQRHQWRLATDLRDAVDTAGGRDAVLRCGTPYVGRLRGPMTAYALDVAKREVEPDAAEPRPPGVVFRSRLHADHPVLPARGAFTSAPRRAGAWEVVTRCG